MGISLIPLSTNERLATTHIAGWLLKLNVVETTVELKTVTYLVG